MIVDDERAMVALAEETLAGLGYAAIRVDSKPSRFGRLSPRNRAIRSLLR